MDLPTEFPNLTTKSAVATAGDAEYYMNGYDIIVHRTVLSKGPKEHLQPESYVCRFCGRSRPEANFKKFNAHAISHLTGNNTLFSLYECRTCNARFSGYEADLGTLTLLDRQAAQVLGKDGVPSAKTSLKKSRIDFKEGGLVIQEHEGDPIALIDEINKTMTISTMKRSYRPLGVYKSLLKMAATLLDQADVDKIPEAIKWLGSDGLTENQIDDGTGYTCLRTFTPGMAPFGQTRVMILRRKNKSIVGPAYIFFLAYGCTSFQIVLPAPQEDRHLVGQTFDLHPIPLIAFLKMDRVFGKTRTHFEKLGSTELTPAPPSIVYHFESIDAVEIPNSQSGEPPNA
ncbi:hypothetical protein MKK67_00415 [Methylobacterium sp. J-072]|uniref:hypothetical protein n=1 Tax=Methylobacterium sp. J-072 TaxID=2836651 RepID=UPI001FB8E8EB|nr:hypothetical protein [Methylobacterium sp. J-072]MCJ2090978.1 hypothetical protein [Methylobacterium sp. J-072]